MPSPLQIKLHQESRDLQTAAVEPAVSASAAEVELEVRYFMALAKRLNRASKRLLVPAGTDVDGLRRTLATRGKSWAEQFEPGQVKAIVNRDFVNGDHRLASRGEVALISTRISQ